MSRSLAGEVNLRQIAYSFGPYRGGLDFNHDDKHVQCNLLLDNSSSSGETTADYEGRTLNWRILNRLKQFCQQTSGHGIPWLGSSPNIFYRSIWLALVVFCLVLFSVQAINLLQKYNKKEKITSIQLNTDSASFPAITICNLNPYLHSSVKKIQSAQKIIQVYKSLLLSKTEGHNSSKRGVDEEIIQALGFENMTDEVALITKARENIIFAMSALDIENRKAASTQKHHLIHKCSFNGQGCDIDNDFKFISDPSFGNCFMFNYNASEPKYSSRAGATYGLRLLAYVNTTEYLPITEAVGVRITIHDQNEFAFPETSGYSAPTGFISSFGIKLTKLSRLPEPYGKCVPSDLTDEDYLYQGFQYSLEGCYRSCLQKMAIERCGCGDPRFPVFGADYCQVFDPEARRCLEEISESLGVDSEYSSGSAIKCQCTQPCDQPSYAVSYSCSNKSN